jgi:23S rRNA pseudouridine2605 synthase
LVTNDGGLARVLELPATGWLRRYRVRALGRVRQEALDRLKNGVTIDGIHYGPIEATLDREQGANIWLTFAIREGKNREVRKVLESLGLKVNRLIRVAFGPFDLGDIEDGAVREVETSELRIKLGEQIVAESNADFDAPLAADEQRPPSRQLHRDRRRETREPQRSDKDAKRPSGRDKHRAGRRDRSGGPRPSRPR